MNWSDTATQPPKVTSPTVQGPSNIQRGRRVGQFDGGSDVPVQMQSPTSNSPASIDTLTQPFQAMTRFFVPSNAPNVPSNAPAISEETGHRFVSHFKIRPHPLKAVPAVQRFIFDLSKDAKAHLETFPEAALLRLRCCAISAGSSEINEIRWVVSEATFPSHVYFSINGQNLEVPVLDFHHKFRPIDVTKLVKEGENELMVIINRLSTDDRDLRMGLSIEVIAMCTPLATRQQCRNREWTPANDILRSIKDSLSPQVTANNDDDEIMVLDSFVTIPLFEPFSNAKIFDLAVRGKSCVHRQAFDLDVFLETRPKSSISDVTKADAWKCPICGEDARPDSLIIDGFLMQVRAKLAADNMLGTRTIVVDKDGNWKPKEEEKGNMASNWGIRLSEEPEVSEKAATMIEEMSLLSDDED